MRLNLLLMALVLLIASTGTTSAQGLDNDVLRVGPGGTVLGWEPGPSPLTDIFIQGLSASTTYQLVPPVGAASPAITDSTGTAIFHSQLLQNGVYQVSSFGNRLQPVMAFNAAAPAPEYCSVLNEFVGGGVDFCNPADLPCDTRTCDDYVCDELLTLRDACQPDLPCQATNCDDYLCDELLSMPDGCQADLPCQAASCDDYVCAEYLMSTYRVRA
jgi:hypothetical protein